ncbi:hypothetical protein BJF80_12015 [Serinicoccus sp. CUA-874]|uniref:hypothetical protein n=1 Tax=Serinicoccus sp. CUA-874 TaxID=1517939 RepID=UPI0009597EB1|nr:hypothetical protein [Serinicoccus sp. CUA-874]OLT14704.1 hypothetical protein BJF80_12015 [Serinicoccus sp. CUA-874]
MRWVRLGAALAATCLPVSLGAASLAQSPSRAMDSAVAVEADGTTVGRSSDAELIIWQVVGDDADAAPDVTCTVTDDAGGGLSGEVGPGPLLGSGDEQLRRVARYDVPAWVASTTVDCAPDDADLRLTPGYAEPTAAHRVAARWFGGGGVVGVVLVGAGLVLGRRDADRTGASSSSADPTGSGGEVIPPAPGTERPRVRGLTFRPPGEGR